MAALCVSLSAFILCKKGLETVDPSKAGMISDTLRLFAGCFRLDVKKNTGMLHLCSGLLIISGFFSY